MTTGIMRFMLEVDIVVQRHRITRVKQRFIDIRNQISLNDTFI